MKNFLLTTLGLGMAFVSSAQLVNNGGTIVVESGATLFIESSLQNNVVGANTGTITNSGTIEVQGDLTNAGVMTMPGAASKLIFSGNNAASVTSGGAIFSRVEMDKTAQDITLLDDMKISVDLNFVGDDNKVIIGANNLTFDNNATITSADANEYIVADAAGKVVKELNADVEFTFEIGTADDKYTPLHADITGSAYAGTSSLAVNTVSMAQPNIPGEATDFINRYWNADQVGVTDFSADLTGTYATTDLETGSTATLVKGASYNGTDWSYDGASAGANTITGTITESSDFTGTNSFSQTSLKVFLQGAFSGGANTTTLNTSGLLETFALTSPYLDAPASVATGFFASNPNITDWVKIELRDVSTPTTILGKYSAFLMNNGDVVGISGSGPVLLKDGPTSAIVQITHRNHLGIATPSAITLDGTQHNFTTGMAQAYDKSGVVNDAMVPLTGGVFGMFRGDVNSNNVVNGADAGQTKVNSSPIQSNVYSKFDVNLNGIVNGADAGQVKASSSPIKTAHVY